MVDNLGFQERWEFRRKEVNEDSSSDDDSKSNSEQVLKSRRLIMEGDYHSDNPTQIEPEEGNLRTKSKSKCRKPRKKQQSRVTKKNKLVNDKADHVIVKKTRRKKNNGFAYDPSLMEDLKSFSESLLKDMKASGEKMFIKMKDEMLELQSSGLSMLNNRTSKMRYAQVLNQRNVRYIHNQMPPGQVDTQIRGLLELNRNQFTMVDKNQLPTRDNADVVCDLPLAQLQRQEGLLLGRGLHNTSLNRPFVRSSGSELTRIPNIQHYLNSERMRNFKAGVPFMNNGTRQLQGMVDERAAFYGNFSRPIMLRQRDNEQRPSSIQHIASGNLAVMNGGFSRMKAEGTIPQIGNSDREQCNAPTCSIRNR